MTDHAATGSREHVPPSPPARQPIRHVLARGDFGAIVRIAGWIRTRRDSKGGFSFLAVNDGSSQADLQVVADGALPNYGTDVLSLHTGASVAVTGELVASPAAGQKVELRARELHVYGLADPELYPLQKKKIGLDRLRELAHLRGRTNTLGAVMRVRNALAYAAHRFFQERDFLYLHTPIITASDCEGAGAMFRVTATPPPPAAGEPTGGNAEFFGKPAYLTVSGQLEGETYACALGRIYTFGPTFRAENSNTRRHLSEFWMIEPEMAFADLNDDATLAEDFVRHLVTVVLDRCSDEVAFFTQRMDPDLAATLRRVADSGFRRVTYTEAVDVLARSGERFEFPVAWGDDLQSEHERYLTEKAFDRPVVVTDFPERIKAFYMRLNDDGRTVAAMDVLVPRVGEIVGGSQREERLDVLMSRYAAKGLNPAAYEWFTDLRRFGTVPHAGFGLGFERMVQFCTGMQNIRDTIPFPRTPGHAEF